MDFGNSIFLWGLPLVLLPLLLHLFFKRRKTRVQFSTLLFFVKKERYFAYRRKILEIILLILRMTMILLLVLALSRMFFKKFNFISGAGTEAVIILDDSMSMQSRLPSGGTTFDFAQSKAEEILSSLSGDDGAALILLSGKPGVNLTRDKTAVVKALRSARLTATAGSLGAAVQTAIEQLRKAPGVNREIYILSDFKKSGKPSTALNIAELGNCRVFCLPLRGSEDNLSVDNVTIDSTPKVINRPVIIPFKVVNHGKNPRDVRVELEIDGREMQTRQVSVGGKSSAADRFVYIPARSGRVNGSVKIDDDNISLDDRAYFSFNIAGSINVLLVRDTQSGKPDPFYFLRLAINPVKNQPAYGISTESADITDLKDTLLKDKNILCLSLSKPLDAAKAEIIKNFLDNGGTLFTFPEADSVPETYASIARATGNEKSAIYREIVPLRKSGIIFNKPLTEFNDLLQLDMIKWRKIQQLVPFSSGKTLARVDGQPMLLELTAGRGKWLAAAFDLRRDFSNWPLLKSFPVVTAALINYAAGNSEQTVSTVCGENIQLKGDKVSCSTSYGRNNEISQANGKTVFTENWLPGIIFFSGADIELAIAKPDSGESATEQCDDGEVKDFFNAPVTLLDSSSDLARQAEKLRKGMELSGIFLLLLLLLLAVEFLLGGSRAMMIAELKQKIRGRAK
ncbi:MAG: BatA and WFA domain-containing protein [Victivallaceae bacterium]